MKRSKKLIALLVVLVVVCAATFALTQYEEKQEQIRSSEEVVLQIPADTVKALRWEAGEAEFAFHKGEDGWRYDADEAFPVSEEKIGEILSGFENFSVKFIIEDVEDYEQYGLEEPEGTLHIETEAESYAVRLGAFSQMDALRYVDIGDGNVYLVSHDPMDDLETELSGMIEHDALPEMETVTKITFEGGENYTIVRNEDSPDSYNPEDVYFAEVDGEARPLDTEKVEAYVDTIRKLSLVTYATYNASEEELAAYGLETPELSVTVSYTVHEDEENEVEGEITLHLGRNAEELAAYEEALEAGEEELPTVTKYVRVGNSQIVYEIYDGDEETLRAAGYDALRHGEVFWAEFDSVTRMDIELEGKTHTLTAEADEDDADAERVWHYDGAEVDVSGVQAALAALTAEEFTDESAAGKEEIGLVLYLEDENFPEVEIRLDRYDGTRCLAVVDGESVSLVSRSAVMELVEAVQTIVLGQMEAE